MGCAAAPLAVLRPASQPRASSAATHKSPDHQMGGAFVQLNFELEVEAGGQQGGTACGLAGKVRSVGFVVVGLVGQVLYVQL